MIHEKHLTCETEASLQNEKFHISRWVMRTHNLITWKPIHNIVVNKPCCLHQVGTLCMWATVTIILIGQVCLNTWGILVEWLSMYFHTTQTLTSDRYTQNDSIQQGKLREILNGKSDMLLFMHILVGNIQYIQPAHIYSNEWNVF